MRRNLACLGVTATVLLAAACGDSPTTPSRSLTGTWTGEYTRGALSGTITMELTQSGPAVSGSWSTSIGPGATDAGSLAGTVTGVRVGIGLTPHRPVVCSPGVTLSGTLALTAVVDDDRLTGDYVVFLCDDVGTGRIDVVRR